MWENSTTANFTFPFSVSDAHSGIQSWTLQSRPVGSASWTTAASGTAGGAKNPPITGVEGTRTDYRVVATDKQGNQKIRIRRVYIPTDDDDLAGELFSVPPVPVPNDDTAFGESYSTMTVPTSTFTYTWTPGTDCLFELIGPSSGTWSVDVTAGDDRGDDDHGCRLRPGPATADALLATRRARLPTSSPLNSGVFGLDAVLG